MRCPHNSILIAEVDMLPLAVEVFLFYISLRHSSIAFGHHHRPTILCPTDGAYPSKHHCITCPNAGIVLWITLLRAVVPITLTILEHGAVAYSHPTMVVVKLVWMSHYRVSLATIITYVNAVYAVIRTIDVL